MAGNVKEFADGNWEGEVVGSNIPVLVDFWAPWCAPCRAIAPSVEQLANEYAGRAKVGKLNIDDNPGVSERYHVRSIPTLLIFKGGQPVGQIVGAMPKGRIEDLIKQALK